MKFKTALTLVALFLAVQGEAYDPDNLDQTANAAISSAKLLVTKFVNLYSQVPIVCEDDIFKAKAIATNAVCQRKDDFDAMDFCRTFGSECISVPGKWGCGSLKDGERGCFFQPRRVPNGRIIPKIAFDFDDEDMWARYRYLHYQ